MYIIIYTHTHTLICHESLYVYMLYQLKFTPFNLLLLPVPQINLVAVFPGFHERPV